MIIRQTATISNRAEPQGAVNSAVKVSTLKCLLPMVFFMAYLNLTVLLFVFGPWAWPVMNGTKLYGFLALAHIALLVGYLHGIRKETPAGYFVGPKPERLVWISIVVTLALAIPTTLFRTGNSVPDIASSLTDPGSAYAMTKDIRETSDAASIIVEYVRILFGPLFALLLPLTIFYWRRLSHLARIAAVLGITINLLIYVAMGTNKGIADFILLTPWLFIAAHFSGALRTRYRSRLFFIISGVLFVAFFGVFFAAGQITRPGTTRDAAYFSPLDMTADLRNPFVRHLPPTAQSGATALASYLTQGYYALYLSLDKPFVPMFGLGNSTFLSRNIARLSGYSQIETLSYPARNERENGWDAYGNWSTIYAWLASDFSFPGTILVVALIGYLFALSWRDTLQGMNPFAVVACTQFLTMLYYFPANNQCLQSGESFTAFIGIVGIWLFTRKYRPRVYRVFRRYR